MTDTNTLPVPLLQVLGLSETEFKKKVRAGTLTVQDIAKAVLPGSALPDKITPAPLPVALTTEQRAAIDKVPQVFGSVVPKSRRALTNKELAAIYDERQTLDTVKRLAEDRQKEIRTTVLNHIDVEIEKDAPSDRPAQDSEGHYLDAKRVPVPGTVQDFSWEIRESNPGISPESLKALVESGELSQKDYLAMTVQTRVVDENAIMSLLAKKPELLGVIAKAATPGRKTGSLYVRKAKA